MRRISADKGPAILPGQGVGTGFVIPQRWRIILTKRRAKCILAARPSPPQSSPGPAYPAATGGSESRLERRGRNRRSAIACIATVNTIAQ